MVSPVTGSHKGRMLSFLTTETETEAGMTGKAFLDLDFESAAPRFAFGIEKNPGAKVAIDPVDRP